jgi:hypothetical protein
MINSEKAKSVANTFKPLLGMNADLIFSHAEIIKELAKRFFKLNKISDTNYEFLFLWNEELEKHKTLLGMANISAEKIADSIKDNILPDMKLTKEDLRIEIIKKVEINEV